VREQSRRHELRAPPVAPVVVGQEAWPCARVGRERWRRRSWLARHGLQAVRAKKGATRLVRPEAVAQCGRRGHHDGGRGRGCQPLGQAKVDEAALGTLQVEEKVGWLDVTVDDLVRVHIRERLKERPHVPPHIVHVDHAQQILVVVSLGQWPPRRPTTATVCRAPGCRRAQNSPVPARHSRGAAGRPTCARHCVAP
jgi:hypothetical protein